MVIMIMRRWVFSLSTFPISVFLQPPSLSCVHLNMYMYVCLSICLSVSSSLPLPLPHSPVFPDVGSISVYPGFRVPSFSASSTIFNAMRSLTLPPALKYSHLATEQNKTRRRKRGIYEVNTWKYVSQNNKCRKMKPSQIANILCGVSCTSTMLRLKGGKCYALPHGSFWFNKHTLDFF